MLVPNSLELTGVTLQSTITIQIMLVRQYTAMYSDDGNAITY